VEREIKLSDMILTKGCVKNYHWGKKGGDSYIARFQSVAPKPPSPELNALKFDDQTPMAELWFGSHPSGPATLAIGDQIIKLNKFLAREPEMVGVVEKYLKYNKQLPFLFKILSVAEPLSLQAHPDKKLAAILHKQDPKNYPDSNHKPELAIALTDFHVLCDFRPHEEILNFLKLVGPLKAVVGEKNYQHYKEVFESSTSTSTTTTTSTTTSTPTSTSTTTSTTTSTLSRKEADENHRANLRLALAACFKSLMTSQKEVILKETEKLKLGDVQTIGKDLQKLIMDLAQLYPGDPGVFAPFFLNYLKLNPGEGVFLKPNKLHAYLKGECIECMACSDNVVRAGLTTKFRDVLTLVNMLDYESVKSGKDLILAAAQGVDSSGCSCTSRGGYSVTMYKTPTEEFKVEKLTVANKTDVTLDSKLSGSFLIVLSGKATTRDFFDLKQEHIMGFGFAAYIPPKIEPKIFDIKGTLIMYRAYC